MRTTTVETLTRHFNLVVVGAYKLNTKDVANIGVVGSVEDQGIESTANQLDETPDPGTGSAHVRTGLMAATTGEAFEGACDVALLAQLPPSMQGQHAKLGLGLTLMSYPGEPSQDGNGTYRDKGRSATTHLHSYVCLRHLIEWPEWSPWLNTLYNTVYKMSRVIFGGCGIMG